MAEKTTEQKIAESRANYLARQKASETQAKINAVQQRRAEREMTPQRKLQVEEAQRRLRNQEFDLGQSKIFGGSEKTLEKQRISREQQKEFGNQLASGFSRRTGLTKEGDLFAGAQGSEFSGTAQNLTRGGKVDLEGGPDFVKRLKNEIGNISEEGPTQEQNQAIKALEEYNRNFQIQQEQNQKREQAQMARGSFTGGVPAQDLLAPSPIQEEEKPLEGAPAAFQQQVALAGGIQQAEYQVAEAQYQNKEQLREQQLRSSLSKLSLGDEKGNVLSAMEGTLGKLSLPQLEELASKNGLELTQDLKDSLTRDGKSAIEREKLTKEQRLAENEFSQRQLSRSYDRAITDREEFNLQQDSKLRRLASSFGGGKSASFGANVSVMKEAEKGVKAVGEMRTEFADKTMLVSRQADEIITTYSNNLDIIHSQMSETIENKYAEITNTIDDLLSAGVTNETELNNAILKAKKDYAKTYTDVSVKAFEAVEKQNQQFFENQIKLREMQQKEQVERQQGIFGGGIFGEGEPRSTMTTNTNGMQLLSPPPSPNGNNCVLYAREQVPNLPYGLYTKSDKKRAVEQYGFRDPSQLQIGDAVLTAEGDVGHAAVIIGIDQENNLILEEANYKSGQITRGRTIAMDDANIYGFIPSNGKQAPNAGGNISLEGTNTAIQSQVNQMYAQETGDFIPQTPLDEEALALAKGGSTIADLKSRGATEQEINAIVSRSRQISNEYDFKGQEARSTAIDIMNGNSFLTLKDMPQAERVAVSKQLTQLKEQARENGDVVGFLRSSAGGGNLSETATTKLEKTFTVLNQLGNITEHLNAKKIQSKVPGEEGKKFDISPLTGYIKKKNPWNLEAQELNAMLQGTIPNLSRGVFGEVGVLTDRDVELYRKTLPNLQQTADVQKSITGITLRVLRDSIANQLKTQAAAGKDVSGFVPIYEDITSQINQIESELGIDSSQGAAENGIIGNRQIGNKQIPPIQVGGQQTSGALSGVQSTFSFGGGNKNMSSSNRVKVKDSKGNTFAIPSSQLIEAQSSGYTLVK